MTTESQEDLFEIEVPADAPLEDKATKPPEKVEAADKGDDIKVEKAEDVPAAAATPKVIEPEEGIAALKANLEREKQARVDAERARAEAEARATASAKEVQDGQLQVVTSAIDQVKQKLELARSQYRDARASGDIEAEIKAQEEISRSNTYLVQLEQGKKALETRPPPVVAVPKSNDPVENLARGMERDGASRAASWIRQHPEYARDTNKYNEMLAAHYSAVSKGHAAETDGYFDAIEKTLGMKAEPVQTHEEPRRQQQAPATPPAAAPPSRSSGGSADGKRVVRLSRDEREMAAMMGMTEADYARNKLALIKEGAIKQ